MTLNYPGPYQIELVYTVGGLTHRQRINCDCEEYWYTPGTPFSSIRIIRKDASLDYADDVVDEYINVIKELCASDLTWVSAELFKVAANSFDKTWISSYAIGVAGTGTSSYVPAGELIFTFRTEEGGTMKMTLEEGNRASGVSIPAGSLTGTEAAFVAYVVAADTWILARDTSYPIAALWLHPGQNEATFKKRFRS